MDLKEIASGLPETGLIYLEDPYRQVNSSQLLRSVRESGRNYYAVVDSTIFHPKSGGQPSDSGWLKGNGFTLEVRKVFKVGGHVVLWGKAEGSPEPGKVQESIDWGKRYLYMRRHAAAHLFDAALEHAMGGTCDPKDSWLGDEAYVGYRGKPPDPNEVSSMTSFIDDSIARNLPVTARIVKKEELNETRALWSSVIQSLDEVRLVQIDGLKPVPCAGTHVHALGEIGKVKLVEVRNVQEGFDLRFDVEPQTSM
ncbi:MAG: alanyl-tRNA editing protein [Nitrososphaerota archaeon]|jgi:alanyl-tRNA synthetase|nr:alanyl-tRNA editing protein [Nitrososphaerota archaeon]